MRIEKILQSDLQSSANIDDVQNPVFFVCPFKMLDKVECGIALRRAN